MDIFNFLVFKIFDREEVIVLNVKFIYGEIEMFLRNGVGILMLGIYRIY